MGKKKNVKIAKTLPPGGVDSEIQLMTSFHDQTSMTVIEIKKRMGLKVRKQHILDAKIINGADVKLVSTSHT